MTNTGILLLSYLIGSISFAFFIGKIFYKTDIRKFGSGNLGTTNTFRVLGKKPGIIVLVGDVSKGIIACFFPLWFDSSISPIICGLLAIIGHVFPIFAGFKGGKAVATSAGVFLFLVPFGCLIGSIIFLLSLFTTKYVSLSSMLSIFSLFVYSLFFENTWMILFSLIISIGVVVLHRKNIKRLWNGTEQKIGKKKRREEAI